MSKMKLKLSTKGIDTTFLGDTDVHYRVILHEGIAKVACVQEFDYRDYAKFIGKVCFLREKDATKGADLINEVGVSYFI